MMMTFITKCAITTVFTECFIFVLVGLTVFSHSFVENGGMEPLTKFYLVFKINEIHNVYSD